MNTRCVRDDECEPRFMKRGALAGMIGLAVATQACTLVVPITVTALTAGYNDDQADAAAARLASSTLVRQRCIDSLRAEAQMSTAPIEAGHAFERCPPARRPSPDHRSLLAWGAASMLLGLAIDSLLFLYASSGHNT